jgi:hypothetical protein
MLGRPSKRAWGVTCNPRIHRNSHKFDGVTPTRIQGSYQLIDVEDDFVRPLIDQEGEHVLRPTPDRNTGWYTPKHYEKIRQVLQARFHTLAEEGVPATREDCDVILAQVNASNSSRAVKTFRPMQRN